MNATNLYHEYVSQHWDDFYPDIEYCQEIQDLMAYNTAYYKDLKTTMKFCHGRSYNENKPIVKELKSRRKANEKLRKKEASQKKKNQKKMYKAAIGEERLAMKEKMERERQLFLEQLTLPEVQRLLAKVAKYEKMFGI